MQIQFQSSMMKISYDCVLQETSLLTKDKRSRIEYVAKMNRRCWDEDRRSLFLKNRNRSAIYDIKSVRRLIRSRSRKTGDTTRVLKEIKMSMRYLNRFYSIFTSCLNRCISGQIICKNTFSIVLWSIFNTYTLREIILTKSGHIIFNTSEWMIKSSRKNLIGTI